MGRRILAIGQVTDGFRSSTIGTNRGRRPFQSRRDRMLLALAFSSAAPPGCGAWNSRFKGPEKSFSLWAFLPIVFSACSNGRVVTIVSRDGPGRALRSGRLRAATLLHPCGAVPLFARAGRARSPSRAAAVPRAASLGWLPVADGDAVLPQVAKLQRRSQEALVSPHRLDVRGPRINRVRTGVFFRRANSILVTRQRTQRYEMSCSSCAITTVADNLPWTPLRAACRGRPLAPHESSLRDASKAVHRAQSMLSTQSCNALYVESLRDLTR